MSTTRPFTALIERQESKIEKLEEEVRQLRDMRERIVNILNTRTELDEHGNSKPYRYDRILAEINNAVNYDWTYQMPWRVVR